MRWQQWCIPPLGAVVAGSVAIAFVRQPMPIVAVSSAGALVGSWLSDRRRTQASDSAMHTFEMALAAVERKLADVETKLDRLPASSATRRTAIFYDIENLIKGYNIRTSDVAKISLKSIQERITEVYPIERVLLQRAYANWSDTRLGPLRREMHQLGIEPVQVFGFSYENRKNAADIQLAIDVTDAIFRDPQLDTFVIVSGDGGFGSLAKKLRQYGKTVIGCAYEDAAGKSFQAICDVFVHIPDPTLARQSEPPLAAPPAIASPPVLKALPADPDNQRLCQALRGSATCQAEGAIAKTREVLEWYRRDPHCAAMLRQEGLAISKVQEAVQALLPQFHILQLGMVKFSEYLRYVCKNTVFCVFHLQGSPNQLKLGLRESLPPRAIAVANFEKRPLHSLATYRALLEQQRCTLALPATFAEVLPWLLQHRDVAAQLPELAALFLKTTSTQLTPSHVEKALVNCQEAGILVPAPEGGDRYFVAASITDEAQCQASLRQWIGQLLQPHLHPLQEHPKPELLEELLPFKSPKPPSVSSQRES
ncbi:NYN domain-containing protein [Synechococcus sp. PCC 6716]|nr:NYN domain-containing protein [Synechococcus sp. PCC 6716]